MLRNLGSVDLLVEYFRIFGGAEMGKASAGADGKFSPVNARSADLRRSVGRAYAASVEMSAVK